MDFVDKNFVDKKNVYTRVVYKFVDSFIVDEKNVYKGAVYKLVAPVQVK